MAKQWVWIASVAVVGLAFAQEETTEGRLLEELSVDHPALVSLRTAVNEAEAELLRARALDNPTVRFDVEAPADLATQSTLALGWSPPLDGRRKLRMRAAESSLDAARLDLASAELRLYVAARETFADWAVAHRRRELLAAHLQVIERIARHVRARADAGETSGLSARRVELAAVEERAELARLESLLSRTRAALRVVYPRLSVEARPILPTLPRPTVGIDPNERPDVLARLAAVRTAEIETREASRFMAFPSLELGWQRVEQSGLNWSGPVYGFAWSIPLFDRREGDRLDAARRFDAAKAQAEITTRRSRADAEGAESAYTFLREAAAAAGAAVVDGDNLIEGATTAYDLGEADMTDLLETLRSVLRARLTALELHADALAAHRALEVAMGRRLLSVEGAHP
jgi:cobalt-zinc-cadmium efflux system outer membrane protein